MGGQTVVMPVSEPTVAQPLSKLVTIARAANRRFQHPALDIMGLLRDFEAFGHALPDIAAATKVWRPLFDSEAQVFTEAIALVRGGWMASEAHA